ncbi:hypothetical protein F7725_010866 [Dissostichus mawsoni]|uniref:Uncharacterized protein n=1 Tax=Dissostichus mawsoni TaxID=36200 RepID=A0A7J5Z7C4_DISMA|nr:hypothetical protein F7725_010866 [Dissostichus mawsoni]
MLLRHRRGQAAGNISQNPRQRAQLRYGGLQEGIFTLGSSSVCVCIWDTTSHSSPCSTDSSLPRSMYPSNPGVLDSVSGLEISDRKRIIPAHSCSRKSFMKAMFWMTLAMRVRVREVRSSGYSCIRPNREGDMMAGHRKRRKSEALIRRWLMSCWWPRASHCCRHEENTSFSSRGTH